MLIEGTRMLAASGSIDVTDSYCGTLQVIAMQASDYWATWRHTGSRRSNTPSGPFDRMSLRAVGMLWSVNGETHGRGAWEFLDKDKDRLFALSERTGETTIWRFSGGTGKYLGIIGKGEYKDLDPFPQIEPGTYQQSPIATGQYVLG